MVSKQDISRRQMLATSAAAGGLALSGGIGAFAQGATRIDQMAAVEPDGSGAVGAAELGVVVDESFGDGLEFPEGFVAATELEAATLDLALVDFFGFGGHGVLLGGAVVDRWWARVTHEACPRG